MTDSSIWTKEYFCQELCKFREEMGERSSYNSEKGIDRLLKGFTVLCHTSLKVANNQSTSKDDKDTVTSLLQATKLELDMRLSLAVFAV